MQAHSAQADCSEPLAQMPAITKGSFTVSSLLSEIETRFWQIYESDLRLYNRAYRRASDQALVVKRAGQEVVIAEVFIQSLTRQLETAMARGYGDFLFYPDLGHVHLHLPQSLNHSSSEPEGYEALLKNKDLRFLYHTGELIRFRKNLVGELTEDPWLQWRYFSRNFVASLVDPENLAVLFAEGSTYNTVRDLPDHDEKGRAYFSANRAGCFPITIDGETRFFDLTFE